jgi:hypothetical protein
MSLTALQTYSGKKLIPSHNPDLARTIAAALAQGTYVAGTVLGEITAANVNDVQTITVSGTPTHSTITLSNLPDGSTITFAQSVSPAAMATAINAQLGAGSVGVTGTADASYVITFSGGSYAGQPIPAMSVSATFAGGTTPSVAIAHTTTGVGPNKAWRPYASGNTDGSQIPQAILAYNVKADYAGNITGVGEYGQSFLSTPAYNRGQFYCGDLTGLDANAVTAGAWRLLEGSTITGEVELP